MCNEQRLYHNGRENRYSQYYGFIGGPRDFQEIRNSVVNHIEPIVYCRGKPHLFAASNIVIKENEHTRFVTVRRKKSTRYRRLGTTKQQLPIELASDVE